MQASFQDAARNLLLAWGCTNSLPISCTPVTTSHNSPTQHTHTPPSYSLAETESQRAARYATGDSISLSDTAVDAYDSARLRSARSPVAAETRDALAGAREGVASGLGAAKDRTLDAKDSLVSGLETAKDKTAGAAQAVADRVAGAAHSVTDSLSAASDNALWAVEHTKEQVQKKADDWQAELTPTTESEARVARGEVPSDTQSLLAAKGLGAEVSHATHINRAQ